MPPRRPSGTWLPPRHWWHTPTVREFLEAVRNDAPVAVPAREARRSLELVGALYQSALSGDPVRLPLDETSPVYDGVDPDGFRSRGGAEQQEKEAR